MSNNQPLPPDDSPPPVSLDWELGRELDEIAAQYFYQDCDRTTQKILSRCGWYLSSFIEYPTLVIACPDQVTNWLILKQLMPLARILRQWLTTAQIRIYPPPGEGNVLELSVLQDIP
ncbi:hypothetical protein cce_4691 [Crocosphaera subtropica ATCC 51142]|uniref:Uncharacterized protein n=1 Tax=Crocosphaera subtropica (strain ATCC 51142 / BH68) TaxID=43989 RepID=B1WWB1_CROS5|nr:hypothetical protein [Crocosphaera subtropica]ACB54039.1 hypothetical protein cce_4691 [Crocosphaera subtropica ATCC 51142]